MRRFIVVLDGIFNDDLQGRDFGGRGLKRLHDDENDDEDHEHGRNSHSKRGRSGPTLVSAVREVSHAARKIPMKASENEHEGELQMKPGGLPVPGQIGQQEPRCEDEKSGSTD